MCFGDLTLFSMSTFLDTEIWSFGDLTSGLNNTSTLLEPKYLFTMLGGYTITATAILGISRTIKEEIITNYR